MKCLNYHQNLIMSIASVLTTLYQHLFTKWVHSYEDHHVIKQIDINKSSRGGNGLNLKSNTLEVNTEYHLIKYLLKHFVHYMP